MHPFSPSRFWYSSLLNSYRKWEGEREEHDRKIMALLLCLIIISMTSLWSKQQQKKSHHRRRTHISFVYAPSVLFVRYNNRWKMERLVYPFMCYYIVPFLNWKKQNFFFRGPIYQTRLHFGVITTRFFFFHFHSFFIFFSIGGGVRSITSRVKWG